MSLASAIASAVDSAFDAAGDLKVIGSITNENGNTYNTTTRTFSAGTPVTDSLVSFVKYDFKRYEINGDTVRHGDSRFMAKTADLTSNYRDYDSITVDGRKWEIVGNESVPGESIAIFQVRLTSG